MLSFYKVTTIITYVQYSLSISNRKGFFFLLKQTLFLRATSSFNLLVSFLFEKKKNDKKKFQTCSEDNIPTNTLHIDGPAKLPNVARPKLCRKMMMYGKTVPAISRNTQRSLFSLPWSSKCIISTECKNTLENKKANEEK